ncbi:unnamed protein product, partial [Amoebophrya sp. A25]
LLNCHPSSIKNGCNDEASVSSAVLGIPDSSTRTKHFFPPESIPPSTSPCDIYSSTSLRVDPSLGNEPQNARKSSNSFWIQ